MRRPHSLVILILAVVITVATFFFPPVFPEGKGKIEHGFPFPWAFQTDLPGSSLPIIGPLIGLLATATLTFSWQFFLADVAIFCTILFMIFNTFGNHERDELK